MVAGCFMGCSNKMITNVDIIKNVYKCKKPIAVYLIYTCKLPLLSFDKKFFYFSDNDKLQECIKSMPLILKIGSLIG